MICRASAASLLTRMVPGHLPSALHVNLSSTLVATSLCRKAGSRLRRVGQPASPWSLRSILQKIFSGTLVGGSPPLSRCCLVHGNLPFTTTTVSLERAWTTLRPLPTRETSHCSFLQRLPAMCLLSL